MDRNLIRNLAADLSSLSESNNLTTSECILLRRLSQDAGAIDDVASQLDEMRSDRDFYKRRTEELTTQVNDLQARVAKLSTSTESLARLEYAASNTNGDFFAALRDHGNLVEFLSYIATGQYINAIKLLRSAAGCGLREGKDYVEAVRDFVPGKDAVIFRRESPPSTQDNQQSRDDIPF